MIKEEDLFFKQDFFVDAVSIFLSSLRDYDLDQGFEKNRNDYLISILKNMRSNPIAWNKHCPITINSQGSTLLQNMNIQNGISYSKEHFDSLFAICFKFVFEFHLSTTIIYDFDLDNIIEFAIENIEEFELSATRKLNHTIKVFPISLFKHVSNGEAIESIKNFNARANIMEDKEKKWELDFKKKEDNVSALKSKLDDYEKDYNFVALYDGFKKLGTQKQFEKSLSLGFLFFLGSFIIATLTVEIYYVLQNIETLKGANSLFALTMIPMTSLIFIIIYFFRIVLHNYKAVKSQLLQIELRQTLCQFIDSYSHYAKDINDKSPETLKKFEQIIFSNIASSDDKLPSTFEGIDQFSNLVKAFKK